MPFPLADPCRRMSPASHSWACRVLAFALLGTAACGEVAQDIAWTVSFADPADAADSEEVWLQITRGSCPPSGEALYQERVTRERTSMLSAPGELAPGQYALEAVAYDEDGLAVASGCEGVTLPGSQSVHIVLTPGDDEPLTPTGMPAPNDDPPAPDQPGDVPDPDDPPTVPGDWATLDPVPYRSGALTSAVLSDGLHVLGGSSDFYASDLLQEHHVYDPASQTWSSSPANIPDDDTWGARAHAFGDRLYLLGGYPAGNRFRVFDRGSNTWNSLPGPPVEFQWGFASAVVDGALYAFGGDSNDDGLGFRYDFTAMRWTAAASIPDNRGRGSLSSVAVGSRIYVLNGNRDDGTTILQIYDVEGDRWSRGASLSGHGFEAAAAAALGETVYFIGGGDDHDAADFGNSTGVSRALHVYDPARDLWTQGPSMGVRRIWATASVVEGRIHVLGGLDSGSDGLRAHETYAP